MSNELEDRLAESLHACAARVRTADVTGLAGRARAGHRRRRLAIRGTLTACAAAGTTAVLVVMLAAPSAPGVPNALTAAYVTRLTEHALAGHAHGDVAYVRITTSPAEVYAFGPRTPVAATAAWSYGLRSREELYDAHGAAVADAWRQPGANGVTVMTVVQYWSATWWRITVRPLVGTRLPSSKCTGPLFGVGSPDAAAPDWAKMIRQALSCGRLIETGHQVVDGQHVIRLEQKAPRGTGQSVYWVSSSSYLPVRIRTESASPRSWVQEDFRWLPPTAANLAPLRVHIPAGFRQVSPQ